MTKWRLGWECIVWFNIFKSINIIIHINKIMEKSLMIVSIVQKIDKMQHSFFDKNYIKLKWMGTF